MASGRGIVGDNVLDWALHGVSIICRGVVGDEVLGWAVHEVSRV